MLPMFTTPPPKLSDYIPHYPSRNVRVRLVEAAGALLGVSGLLFLVGAIPLKVPIVLWMVVASLDLTTMEWAPEAGRRGVKAFSLLFADVCLFAAFSDVEHSPHIIIIAPLFAVAIWLMTRHQPDKETA